MKNFIRTICIAILVTFTLSACVKDEFGNDRSMTNSEKGAIIGASIGALIGLTTKNKRKKKVLLGAVGGGIAGFAVGSYMDSQKKDLEKVLVPERQSGAINIRKNQNTIMITMTSETAFEVDSTRIKQSFYSTLDKISKVVNRYGKTALTIVGHTDSTGSRAYNQKLSERRAQAVHQYFLDRKVALQRLTYLGKGEDVPTASNATESGRRLNRRVDIIIEPVIAN